MQMSETIHRDSEGKIFAFEGTKPGCTWGELLATEIKFSNRKIESDIGDARQQIKKLEENIDNKLDRHEQKLTEMSDNNTRTYALVRESINEFRINKTIQTRTEQEQAEMEKRLKSIESIVISLKSVSLFLTKTLVIVSLIWAFGFGVYKFITGGK